MVPLPRLITHAAKRRSGVVTQIEWRRSSWNFRNKSPLSSSASGQFSLTAASTANRLVIAPAVRRFLGTLSLPGASRLEARFSRPGGPGPTFLRSRLLRPRSVESPEAFIRRRFQAVFRQRRSFMSFSPSPTSRPASPGFATHGRIIQFGSPCDFDVRHLHVRFSN